jgi:hypothetical protein
MMQRQTAPLYEEDFVAWLEDQARHARHCEIDALDLENIAEELEGMARSDRREIRNPLTVLLAHLLKCLVQPSYKRSSSWLGTIAEQRFQIAELLEVRACAIIPTKSSSVIVHLRGAMRRGKCGFPKAPSRNAALSASRRCSITRGCPRSGSILRN